ncbi:MAG: tetratricopeptide repeat protein [Isosphaeraceae bacterium]|nr:tetratricopeptide repeat protein [Isosphaeraceae bacterium]
MSLRRPLLAAPLALVLGLAAVAQAADEVVLIPNATLKIPGGRVRGTIKSESPTEVVIQPTTGAPMTIPVDQIEAITYEGEPATMALARTRAENSPAEAADLFKKAATEAAGKPYIVQAALFGQAEAIAQLALAAPNRLNEAIALLETFHKTYPVARQKAQVLELLARLSLLKDDPNAADRYLAELEKIAWAKDRAVILRADVLAARGQYEEAISRLDKIIADSKDNADQARRAKLAKAKALAGQKKFEDAEKTVREVIQDAPPEAAEIQAVAYNTLGDCLRAAGRPKDALFAYLKTDLLFDKDKEQHARAMAEIIQLWRLLKRDDRADEYQERLRQLYPQSPFSSARPAPR